MDREKTCIHTNRETASYPTLQRSEEEAAIITGNRPTTHYIPDSRRTGRTTGCAVNP